jgi:hypothetical protein
MPGHGYFLVDKELANFLQHLNIPGVTFKDAIVWDRENNKEYHSHKEVIVTQHFTSDQINTLNLEGDRILVMGNEYIFVSPMLKDKLVNSRFNYLEFSEGLSRFAG